ncbi:MAG: cell envelope biogenesis protein TolA, partial [Pseudomonadota bacterium]
PIEVPEPIAPLAPDEQILPSTQAAAQPKPRPADRVSPDPVPTPDPQVETSADPTPATTDTPTPDPVVVPENTNQAVAPEAGDVLRTEATVDQTESLGMQTSLRPKSRPAPKPASAAEPPADAPVADAAQTDAEVQAAIDAALNDAAAEPAAATGTDVAASPAGGEPMTSGEIGDFSRAIGSKWNLGSASTDALRTTIAVRVTFSPDGQPTNIELIETDGPTEAATTTAYEAARRAIQRAALQGGLPLPPDKYDTWKVVELVFDPNGMRMR